MSTDVSSSDTHRDASHCHNRPVVADRPHSRNDAELRHDRVPLHVHGVDEFGPAPAPASAPVSTPAQVEPPAAAGQAPAGRLPHWHDELAVRSDELLHQARIAAEPERTDLLEQVVLEHLWLARRLAQRFANRGEDLDDLIQVARTGLVEAAQRCDPDQGPFLAFATPTILGRLKRHFRDHGWLVRPPRRTQELLSSIRQEWPDLAQLLGTVPNERELSQTLGEELAEVRRAQHASHGYRASSLETIAFRTEFVGSSESLEEMDRAETRLLLHRALAGFTENDRELLRLRYQEQLSQADIAQAIGTSQMQVSRLLTHVHARLRVIIGGLDGC